MTNIDSIAVVLIREIRTLPVDASAMGIINEAAVKSIMSTHDLQAYLIIFQ